MKKIVVFASGSGSNFQTIVDKLHQKTCEVALLVCDKAGAYCLERAEKLHIPTFVFNRKRNLPTIKFDSTRFNCLSWLYAYYRGNLTQCL